MKYVYLILVSALIAFACDRNDFKGDPDKLGITIECKGLTGEPQWCKFTNKKGQFVCAKNGDDGFTVPCEFYDGI